MNTFTSVAAPCSSDALEKAGSLVQLDIVEPLKQTFYLRRLHGFGRQDGHQTSAGLSFVLTTCCPQSTGVIFTSMPDCVVMALYQFSY